MTHYSLRYAVCCLIAVTLAFSAGCDGQKKKAAELKELETTLNQLAAEVEQETAALRQEAAALGVQNFKAALRLFMLDTGRYPSAQEGLRALLTNPGSLRGWNGPYVKKEAELLDPWGNPYHYSNVGGKVEVFSLGADNASGGDGENADVRSH